MHRSTISGGVSIARCAEKALDLISETPVTVFDDNHKGPPERLPSEKLNGENSYLSNSKVLFKKSTMAADDHFPVSPIRMKKKKSVARTGRTDSPVSVMCPFVDRDITKSILPIPSYDEEGEEPQEQSTSTQIKRVRFLVDEYGEIDEQLSAEHSFPNYVLTPQLIAQCWTSKSERTTIKAHIPDYCRSLICKYPEYRKAAIKICVMAASYEAYTKLLEKNLDGIKFLCNAKVRGLERPMFNKMLIPRKKCKEYVYTVLRTQDMIRRIENNNKAIYTYDETSKIIAEQYMTQIDAQYNIRFAFLMGLADADAATQC